MPKKSEIIDWEHLKWGSFTNQFKAFKREHPTSNVDNLEHFAEMILLHPEQYKPRTLKRARFYLNVLAPKIRTGGKLSASEIKNFLDQSYKEHPKEHLDGYDLDKSLSSDTVKVYNDPKTGKTVVAHRGTSGLADWGNNLAYALGAYKYTNRYKKGKTAQDAAEKKYGKENISTLGHSQGAVNARLLGKDTKEIINVNPAYKFETPAKNEYNLRSSADVVSSAFAPVATVRKYLFPGYAKVRDITIPSQKEGVLGEHSYEILDRLGNQEIGQGSGRRVKNRRAEDINWISLSI